MVTHSLLKKTAFNQKAFNQKAFNQKGQATIELSILVLFVFLVMIHFLSFDPQLSEKITKNRFKGKIENVTVGFKGL